MLREELQKLVAEEEKHLGVQSEEFLNRHHEIMELIEQAGKRGCADGSR